MPPRVRGHVRSNIVGYVALFFALTGGAFALQGKNSVDSGDIKPKNVRAGDLAPNAVKGAKIADDSVTGQDVDEASLAGVSGIAAGSIGSAEVADESLTGTDIDESSLALVGSGDLLSASIGFTNNGAPVIERGRGALAVSDAQNQTAGIFEVQFNRDISGCPVTASSSHFGGMMAGTREDFPGLVPLPAADEVYVEIFQFNGNWEDQDFSLIVLC